MISSLRKMVDDLRIHTGIQRCRGDDLLKETGIHAR